MIRLERNYENAMNVAKVIHILSGRKGCLITCRVGRGRAQVGFPVRPGEACDVPPSQRAGAW